MPPQRGELCTRTGPHVRITTTLSAVVFLLMILSPIPSLAPGASSDPGYVDNGDFTKSVLWNFTDAGDYVLYNTSISGGLGRLESVNETNVENTTAQYLTGARTNINLVEVPDTMVIDNTSLPIQTLTLQPGPEGIDCFLDEWFPPWNPDTVDLRLNPEDGHRTRIVMQFDLSAYPAGATLMNATLWLYEKPSKPAMIYYSIHALNHTWGEQDVSWRNGWTTAGGDFSDESFSNGTVDGTNGWHVLDMTRLVDLWTRGVEPNFGFIIVPRNETFDGTKDFSCSDVTNKPEQRPKLVMNYTLGAASGTYESSPLGPGTNATFTLANWTGGFISKASDEFNTGSISTRWAWTNDPNLAGGSTNFARAGWLNITGSQFTELKNSTIGCNYLHQSIDGDFRAETSLEAYFSNEGMGAGLLMSSDTKTWLALYVTRAPGGNLLVAKACKTGTTTTIATVPWNSAATYLRIDRVGGVYQLRSSMSGSVWNTLTTFTPLHDFTERVSIGLCVFSGGTPGSPVVEFDYLRVDALGQVPTLEMRARTGNSTNLADPSWQPWGTTIGPSTGAYIGATGKFVQYNVTLATGWDWLTPTFSGIMIHDERYLPDGVITTVNIYPNDVDTWETMTVTESTNGGSVQFSYSTDTGNTWQLLGTGSSFSLAITEPSMMLRIELRTFDTLVTPTIDTIELTYSVSVAYFEVVVPATVQAGDDFPVTIIARDPLDNVATQWNGTVILHATDATGLSGASAELNITLADIPTGGVLAFSNQRYDHSETIRISVCAGTVRGLSDLIVIEPGSIATLTLTPGNTTMYEHTSEAFTATAEDSLGNVITDAVYSWTVEASLGTLNSSQGSSVTLTVGEYYTGGYLNVSCSSMSVSRWIDVVPIRFAPEFTSPLPDQNRDEDSGEWTLDLSSHVSDPEDPLSKLRWYAIGESIVDVRGENRTGNLIITFRTIQDVSGTVDVTVVVVDSDGMIATTTVHVDITEVNDLPTIDTIDPLTVMFYKPYTYDFSPYVHDPDHPLDKLNLTVGIADAPYLRIDDMFITFTYPESMVGTTRTVVVTVTDPVGGSSSTAVLVKVSDDQVPEQNRMLPSVQLDQGETMEQVAFLPSYFYDLDDDVLAYAALCEHSTIGIDSDGYVNITAPTDWHGIEYAVIRAMDPSGARAEGIMQITVLEVNYPPTIGGVPDLQVHFDQRFEFDVKPYILDRDEYEEEMTLTSSDLHCTFMGTLMSVLYPISMSGSMYPVTITVSDGSFSASCVINITVSSNYPPELMETNPLIDHSFQEDTPVLYPMGDGLQDHFTDSEDGIVMEFIAFSLDSNVTVAVMMDDDNDWKVEFETTPNYYGSSDFVIRASDSNGAIVEKIIMLEVTPVPDAPLLDLPSSFTVIVGQQVLLDLAEYVSDPDSSIDDGDFTFDVNIIQASGTEQDYLDGISTLPGMLMFDYPVGFMKGHDKEFTVEVVVTDQTGKVDRGEMVIILEKAPGGGQDPLFMTAAVLATVGGISATGAVAWVRRKKPFVIRDMMLVHNDGFLIGRYAGLSHHEGEIDQDVLTGMLTAVLNFVDDSMSTSHETLKTFGFKDYQVLVKRGTKTFAAIVFSGDMPDNIEKSVNEFLTTFERVYKKKIANWTGDIDTDFAGVELLIQSFVKENSKRNKKKSRDVWAPKNGNGGTAKK